MIILWIGEVIQRLQEELGIIINRGEIYRYERKGIISVKQADNLYREYKTEDYEKIKQAVGLRKLGYPMRNVVEIMRNGDYKDRVKGTLAVHGEILKRLEEGL